jgi:hypothetical protein
MKKNLLLTLVMLSTFCLTVSAQTTFKFKKTSYVGALSADAAQDWTKTWTNFDPSGIRMMSEDDYGYAGSGEEENQEGDEMPPDIKS